MPYHYPIYCYITRDRGATPRAQFGASEDFSQKIQVGTSRKNSHTLGEITVERYDLDDGARRFTLFIDGKRYRSGVVRNKELTIDEGRADDF